MASSNSNNVGAIPTNGNKVQGQPSHSTPVTAGDSTGIKKTTATAKGRRVQANPADAEVFIVKASMLGLHNPDKLRVVHGDETGLIGAEVGHTQLVRDDIVEAKVLEGYLPRLLATDAVAPFYEPCDPIQPLTAEERKLFGVVDPVQAPANLPASAQNQA